MTAVKKLWPLLTATHRYKKTISTHGRGAGQLIDAPISVPTELILIAGSYVMHVRDRAVEWPTELKPGTLLPTQAVSSDIALLDFELSFGRRTQNGWEILRSTLPWREEQSVSVQLGASQHDQIAMTVDGVVQHWKMMEWSPPLQESGRR